MRISKLVVKGSALRLQSPPMKPSEADAKALPDNFRLIRTDASDPSFRTLVTELDKELAIRDGDEHAFYDQYNKLESIPHAVLLMDGALPAACGAMRAFAPDAVEIKRMFTAPAHRNKGLGAFILIELESWARELNYKRCVLETGRKQPEAIALYTKSGYHLIPNYGQYIGVDSSVCFEKEL